MKTSFLNLKKTNRKYFLIENKPNSINNDLEVEYINLFIGNRIVRSEYYKPNTFHFITEITST